MSLLGCYTASDVGAAHHYEVTIKIPYRSSVPLDPQTLGRFLGLVLEAPEESSQYLDAHLFYHGLRHCIKAALRDVNDAAMQTRYGDQLVPHKDGQGWISRWCLEAEQNPLPVPFRFGSMRVEVRETNGV